MRICFSILLFGLALSSCNSGNQQQPNSDRPQSVSLTTDEKHRLYTAALVATASQYDTELFKDVCRKIGIMNNNGIPTNGYERFVGDDNLEWSRKPEAEQFKRDINSRDKAMDYIEKYLPK